MNTLTNVTYFSMSIEKGLRGNIGKIKEVKRNDVITKEVMLFLTANGDADFEDRLAQIVNVSFPKEAFETLEAYDMGDYVRIHFERINLTKGTDKETEEERLFISVIPRSIELLKKGKQKKSPSSFQSKSRSKSRKISDQKRSKKAWGQ